jgi:hypothetical protein
MVIPGDEDSFFATFKSMSNRSDYRQFCEQQDLPFFLKAAWMDVVCGEKGWDAVLVSSGDKVMAAMPFQIKKRGPWVKLSTPDFTPHSGPWIKPSDKKTTHGITAHYHHYADALIKALPAAAFMGLKLDGQFQDMSPWQWRKLQARPRTNYVLTLDRGITKEDVAGLFNYSVRQQIDLPDHEIGEVGVEEAIAFFKTHHKYWSKEHERITRQLSRVQGLGEPLFLSLNIEGKLSAVFFSWWSDSRLYWINYTGTEETKNVIPFYALLYDATLRNLERTIEVDFMGSQNRTMAQACRSMGASPNTYFLIEKAPVWARWIR